MLYLTLQEVNSISSLCGHGSLLMAPSIWKTPYISFKTFYSIIYTFKVIICNYPSCHILPPFPNWGVCGWLVWSAGKTGGHRASQGARGSKGNQQPFRIPFTFPMLSGSGGSQQEAKGVRTFYIQKWGLVYGGGCPSVGLVRARQTCHHFVSAHGTWSLYTR